MRHIFCIFGQHMPVPARRLKVEGWPSTRDGLLYQCLRCGWLHDGMSPVSVPNHWRKPNSGDAVQLRVLA